MMNIVTCRLSGRKKHDVVNMGYGKNFVVTEIGLYVMELRPYRWWDAVLLPMIRLWDQRGDKRD